MHSSLPRSILTFCGGSEIPTTGCQVGSIRCISRKSTAQVSAASELVPRKKKQQTETWEQNGKISQKTHQQKWWTSTKKSMSRIHAVTEFHPKWDEVASTLSAKMLLDQAILLMEEILHHLGGFEPFEKYNIVTLDHFPR